MCAISMTHHRGRKASHLRRVTANFALASSRLAEAVRPMARQAASLSGTLWRGHALVTFVSASRLSVRELRALTGLT
jgi:hypothetical protein